MTREDVKDVLIALNGFAKEVDQYEYGLPIYGEKNLNEMIDLVMRLFKKRLEGRTDEWIYVVLKNIDMTEGKGPMVLDKVFDNEKTAIKYIEEVDPYKSKATLDRVGNSYRWATAVYEIIKKPVLLVNYEETLREEQREKALKKLTQKERELLGLS